MPTEPSEHADSPSLDAELALTNSETESKEEVPVIKAGDQDKGQARPNPSEQDEGQAGSNPGDVVESQPQPSHVQMDEEFTTTTYPNVQENLKLLTEDQVILKEPASSTGTLSSLQNLDKELNFTDQFFVEKPQEEEPGKTNAEVEVRSMVYVPIHQDTSSVPLMTTPVIDLTKTTDPILVRRIGDLEQHIANLIQNNLALEERLDKHRSRLYNLENLNILHQVSKVVDERVTDAVDWAIQVPLQARFGDLPTVDMKKILQQRMFEDNTYKTHEVHNDLYEALQKSVELNYSNQRLVDQEEARKKKRKRHESPRTPPGSPPTQPPPSPPPAGAFGTPGTSRASGSSQFPPPPPPSSTADIPGAQELSPTDYLMQDDSIPKQKVHLSDDEDSENDHQPKADSRKDWWKPIPEEERPATPEPAWTIPSSNKSDLIEDMTTFMNGYYQKVNKTVLTQADFEGQAYEVVKAFYLDIIHLQFQMEECHKMLTAQVDWTNPEGDHAKYALEILKKHGMEKCDTIGTLMATKPKLDADLSGKLIDQTDYCSKVGSLLGTINMGLWYPKDSGYELTAFTDADHARCLDTRKSTSRGIQFMGDKSEYQLADMFTKALPEDRFQYLVRRNGMRCLTLAELESQPQTALRYKRWCCSLIPSESNSLPHAHAQTTKTYYKHQDSRIKKAQEFKTKTSANSDIQDLPLRYQVYQGRLLASFQDDAKYEHVGQDTRSQDDKDDKDIHRKDLMIS
ncbi:hypothetical protein Tco_1166526 [Tanacetum coccineum]